MTALSFPGSPATYDRYTANGKTWYWDGTTWIYGQGPGPADASFSSVVGLYHFDDAGSPVNHGSGGGVTLLVGRTSGVQTKFGAQSLFVAGSGTQQLQQASDAAYAFGTGDFTIELWVYPSSIANANLVDFRTAASSVCPVIYWLTGGDLRYFVSNVDRITGGAASISSGAWSHVAVARSSTSTKMFVNGAQVGSTYTDSNNYTQAGFALGNANSQAFSVSASPINGYIAEARITKGVARYTTTFTPPTARFPDH